MSQPMLSKLPMELKCQIMESSDSLCTVLALAQTASHFLQAWKLHTRSICNVVLPRSVECYTDAQNLVGMEFAVNPVAETQRNETIVTGNDPEDLSIGQYKRVIINAYAAADACEMFSLALSGNASSLGPYQTRRPAKPYLTPTERARLIHTYYLTRTFLVASTRVPCRHASLKDLPDDFLASTSPRELWRIREFMSWLEMMNDRGLRHLHMEALDSNGFQAFRVSFRKNFRSLRDPYAPGASQSLRISSFFDECQHYLESLSDSVV